LALDFINISGINIQWPWSEYIISGNKTIETRSYPIPKKHLGRPLAVIETPGKLKRGEKAKIVGIVVFSDYKKYHSKKEWKLDFEKHLVKVGDELFDFDKDKPKFGWKVSSIVKLDEPIYELPKSRGIVFARNCTVPKSAFLKLNKKYI
jgi:hypothetical protein